jgi:pimeloyl-ACP methyl ester carboxylesterase
MPRGSLAEQKTYVGLHTPDSDALPLRVVCPVTGEFIMMRFNQILKCASAVAIVLQLGCATAPDAEDAEARSDQSLARPRKKPTIVLVHGAWADALGWQDVIGRLQHDGYPVRAVEIPLSSFAADVEATQRALDASSAAGPVVVAAHSFGGAVVTQAAAGNTNVKALVYINAFVPDVGETLLDLADQFPPTPIFEAFVVDAAGFATIDPGKFQDAFCADLPDHQAAILAAAQKPLAVSSFTEPLTAAAWKTLPTWYLVGKQDRTIHPDLERFMAKRIRARITEIDSSHVSFISHPNVVVRLIEQAAGATVR